MKAQAVVAPLPSSPSPDVTSRQLISGKAARTPLSSIESAFSSPGPLWKRGAFSLRPHLLYRWLYSNGLQTNPGHPTASSIQTVAPGFLLEMGKHWTLEYAPTWTFYSSPEFLDTFGQSASLAGGIAYGDWTFGVSQSYSSNAETLVETGRQTHSVTYSTGFTLSYRLGARTMLESSLSRSVRLAHAVKDSPDWVSADWKQWSAATMLHYKLSSTLDVSGGVDVSYSQLSIGSDLRSTNPTGQITWRPTQKLSFSAQGGVSTLHFVNGGVADLNTPTYSASARYQPFETTSVSVSASRSLSASYFANQITRNTGWSVALGQRFLQKLYFGASANTGTTSYIASVAGAPSGRNDKIFSLDMNLGMPFALRGTFSLLYHIARNSSNDRLYGFSSHQAGFEIGYRF